MLKIWNKKNIISLILYPLSFVYGQISKFNIYIRSKKAYKSPAFIMSVGNITVGGTGKTPLTIAIANYLSKQGKKVAIIGHGYKATQKKSIIADSSYTADQIGDEASQMLKLLDKYVLLVIGQNRTEGVKLAQENGAEVIILDDGFSATYINRDYNIAVFDGKALLGNGFVLPAGPLREPVSGLSRADAIVVINQQDTKAKFDQKTYSLKSKISYSKKLQSKSLYAFCGIGIPDKFYNSLLKEGLCIKNTKSFADHYTYTNKDIEQMLQESKDKSLKLVTTLKDFVKIDNKFSSSIEVIMLKIELNSAFKSALNTKIEQFYTKK